MKRPYDSNTELLQSENLASLGRLAAGLAHEINTPIGSIHSNNDILQRSIAKLRRSVDTLTAAPEMRSIREMNRILDILEDVCRINNLATDRITGIVRSLKNFARLDEPDRKQANLHEGLDSTLMLLQHQFKNRVRIVKQYGDLPEFERSPNALNQVFMNLLTNSAQSISDRGVITVRTCAENDCVKIAISDTGCGIPQENLTKIFDPGFTTKGVGVGTGLGLSICYKIIANHGGRIEVESLLGKGSTFTIILPSKLEKDQL